MMLQSEDKSYLTKWFVGTALLTSLLMSGIYYLITRGSGASGDTPVILVGDSLKFKASSKAYPNYQWQQDIANKAYHTDPQYSIASIAIKQIATADNTEGPVDDDRDKSTDVIRMDVSSTPSWTIYEYSGASPDANPVVSISPDGNYIDLKVIDYPTADAKLKGCLYFLPRGGNKQNRLQFTQNTDCTPDQSKFAKVSLAVTTKNAAGLEQTQNFGSLNCLDSTGNTGTCRIVLRDK